MPKAHTFTALGMPLAPRGPPPRPLVRFAACASLFLSVSVQRGPSRCLLVRFAAPVLLPLCLHPSASARPCSEKPTAGLSHPLRCINPSVSTCFHTAKPTIASLRPLRCIHMSVSACFRAARRIPASFCPLRRPRASPVLVSSTRHSMSSFCEAHNGPFLSASLHPQAHFSLFPSSDVHPSAFSSASQAPGISCPVLSRPLRLLGRGAKSVFNSEASPGIPREASLLNIIIVIIVRARKMLPEFLLAYCGDEFFEVEWLEVCDILEVSGAECRDGRGEHR